VHQRAVVLGQLVGSAGQAQRLGLAGDLELLLDRDRHTVKKAYFVAAPQGAAASRRAWSKRGIATAWSRRATQGR
jgi:hypothetical protein